MNKDSGLETPPTSDAVERHYWKAVNFLVILILVGSGFWGVRRFAPAVFLGKPDLIAVPNKERPQSPTTETLAPSTPELLNINTASAEELQTLPNIGVQMAQRIVDYREQYGEFASVEALQKVKGIGAKRLEKLRPFVDAK
jgi:comEA protein